MTTISNLKQQSGANKFASVLGKSTIDPDSEEYKAITQFTNILLDNGYGIIHGGYAGGAMSAASDTANAYIKEHSLSPCLNIGVPQIQHDGLWERVPDAAFTEAAPDIFQRLQIVTSGDIAVICPRGGDGTELEETIIFHENVVREGINKYSEKQIAPTPLIFFQTKNGTDWRRLLETKLQILDTSATAITDYPWLHIIESLEEFEALIKKLK